MNLFFSYTLTYTYTPPSTSHVNSFCDLPPSFLSFSMIFFSPFSFLNTFFTLRRLPQTFFLVISFGYFPHIFSIACNIFFPIVPLAFPSCTLTSSLEFLTLHPFFLIIIETSPRTPFFLFLSRFFKNEFILTPSFFPPLWFFFPPFEERGSNPQFVVFLILPFLPFCFKPSFFPPPPFSGRSFCFSPPFSPPVLLFPPSPGTIIILSSPPLTALSSFSLPVRVFLDQNCPSLLRLTFYLVPPSQKTLPFTLIRCFPVFLPFPTKSNPPHFFKFQSPPDTWIFLFPFSRMPFLLSFGNYNTLASSPLS